MVGRKNGCKSSKDARSKIRCGVSFPCEMDGIHKFNSLPDDVLIHILSFLPVEEAVKTSFLARRWRNLWSHVPRLDFHSLSRKSNVKASTNIYAYLMRHKARKIESFRALISYRDSKDAPCVDAILHFLVERGIEDLQLTLDTSGGQYHRNKQGVLHCYGMHPCLSKCTTLKNLSLSCCLLKKSSAWLCFNSLKVLCLSSRLGTVLDTSCCPLLEVLILDNCSIKNRLEIHAPNRTLKLLKLQLCFMRKDTSLAIYAPHALHLEIAEALYGNIDIKDLSSVTSVKFFCSCDSFTLHCWMTNFMRNFSHLRFLKLKLSNTSSNVVKWEIPRLTVTILDLHIYSLKDCIHGMVLILESCQYLECLILDVSGSMYVDAACESEIWDRFVAVLYTLTCLKTIKITDFFQPHCYLEGTNSVVKHMKRIDIEIKPIKLFLRCCPKLKKVEIFTNNEWCKRHENQRLKVFHTLTKKMMSLSRASSNAQVSISCGCNMH